MRPSVLQVMAIVQLVALVGGLALSYYNYLYGKRRVPQAEAEYGFCLESHSFTHGLYAISKVVVLLRISPQPQP